MTLLLPSTFKPMLCAKDSLGADDLVKLLYPVFVSPKLDGIRSTTTGRGYLQSRTGKKIPNDSITEYMGNLPSGLDGELIRGSPTADGVYNRTQSAVMSLDGWDEDIRFFVFDIVPQCWGLSSSTPFDQRREFMRTLKERDFPLVHFVPHTVCFSPDQVLSAYKRHTEEGYEGICIRGKQPYKFGRSTNRSGPLYRMKQFEDGEAVILDYEPLWHNANEATTNALGYTERASHAVNKYAQDIIGALHVKDLVTNNEFKVGVFKGVTLDARAKWWRYRSELPGRIIKYRKHAYGEKDKPRQAVFLGWRESWDM